MIRKGQLCARNVQHLCCVQAFTQALCLLCLRAGGGDTVDCGRPHLIPKIAQRYRRQNGAFRSLPVQQIQLVGVAGEIGEHQVSGLPVLHQRAILEFAVLQEGQLPSKLGWGSDPECRRPNPHLFRTYQRPRDSRHHPAGRSIQHRKFFSIVVPSSWDSGTTSS